MRLLLVLVMLSGLVCLIAIRFEHIVAEPFSVMIYALIGLAIGAVAGALTYFANTWLSENFPGHFPLDPVFGIDRHQFLRDVSFVVAPIGGAMSGVVTFGFRAGVQP